MRKPKKLYKYFSFAVGPSGISAKDCNGSLSCADINRSNSIKALRGRYVWASKPLSFNDPFDCQRRMSTKITREVYIRAGLAMGYKRSKMLAASKLMFNKFGKLTSIGVETMAMQIEKVYRKTCEHGVVCFTTTPVNELMWSHYSDCHTGFCLEFDMAMISEWRKNLMAVSYVADNRLPKVGVKDVLGGLKGDSTTLQLILAKSKHWRYEQEWRMVFETGNFALPYPDEVLTGIIFGKNITSENKALLCELAPMTEYRQHYQCDTSDTHFLYNLIKV